MTKYFTDPIKALWMHKEFGVQCAIEIEIQADLMEESYCKNMTPSVEKIYISKESEHIFELKEQDIIITSTDCLAYHEAEFFDKDSKIIMRDGKQFFNPESE